MWPFPQAQEGKIICGGGQGPELGHRSLVGVPYVREAVGYGDWDNSYWRHSSSQRQAHRASWQSPHLAVGRRQSCATSHRDPADVIMKSQVRRYGPHSHKKELRIPIGIQHLLPKPLTVGNSDHPGEGRPC